jgi:plastocyanin
MIATLVLGTVASLALVACGGGSSSTAASSTTSTVQAAGGGGQTINLAADPGGALKYVQSSLSAKAGSDTINLQNSSPLGHDVCVQDSSGKILGCSQVIIGGSTTLNVSLKPGTYTYYCSVDGHRAAGMQGTLKAK